MDKPYTVVHQQAGPFREGDTVTRSQVDAMRTPDGQRLYDFDWWVKNGAVREAGPGDADAGIPVVNVPQL